AGEPLEFVCDQGYEEQVPQQQGFEEGQWLRFLGEANVHTLVTFVAEPKSGSQELVLIKSRSLEFVIFRGEGENVLTHG
ncbi:unnamed protein product, partial [Urochloa humidicola]